MLTRLKVRGFKNLVETEIRFGPFTCIAGPNGVGKSNIFDAIHFLSNLADHSFVEAARRTRGGARLIDLFTVGGDRRMRFECDLLLPKTGRDDFSQWAEATQTYVTYALELCLVEEGGVLCVHLESEDLSYIRRRDAKARLGFGHEKKWRESVLGASSRRTPFIRTVDKGDDRIVRLSVDKMRDDTKSKRGGGRPSDFLARALPRTVLSAAQNADEARTAVLVRAEMRAWRILQLEPSALRQTDDLEAPSVMERDGSHLAATLYRLARDAQDEERVYAEVSNRLSELVDEVDTLRVDKDEARRVLGIVLRDRAGVELPASSLFDGTLRFIALTVLTEDVNAKGVVCLEEPENGINPARMDAMMRLLGDLAVDVEEALDEENVLRQVIVSTHSPAVAARVAPDELLFADRRDAPRGPLVSPCLVLRPIAETWRVRDSSEVSPISRGALIRYLGAIRPGAEGEEIGSSGEKPERRRRRVFDLVSEPSGTMHPSFPP